MKVFRGAGNKTTAVTNADAGVRSLDKATKDRLVEDPEKINKRMKQT